MPIQPHILTCIRLNFCEIWYWRLMATFGTSMAIIRIHKLLHTYIPKTWHYFCFRFLRNDHSRSTVGQGKELWTPDVGKPHFKEQFMGFNYAFFMWVIFGNRKELTVPVKKQHICEWRRFSVFDIDHSHLHVSDAFSQK
jgi:hypothetical protein